MTGLNTDIVFDHSKSSDAIKQNRIGKIPRTNRSDRHRRPKKRVKSLKITIDSSPLPTDDEPPTPVNDGIFVAIMPSPSFSTNILHMMKMQNISNDPSQISKLSNDLSLSQRNSFSTTPVPSPMPDQNRSDLNEAYAENKSNEPTLPMTIIAKYRSSGLIFQSKSNLSLHNNMSGTPMDQIRNRRGMRPRVNSLPHKYSKSFNQSSKSLIIAADQKRRSSHSYDPRTPVINPTLRVNDAKAYAKRVSAGSIVKVYTPSATPSPILQSTKRQRTPTPSELNNKILARYPSVSVHYVQDSDDEEVYSNHVFNREQYSKRAIPVRNDSNVGYSNLSLATVGSVIKDVSQSACSTPITTKSKIVYVNNDDDDKKDDGRTDNIIKKRLSNRKKTIKLIPKWDQFATALSAFTTWLFYTTYCAILNTDWSELYSYLVFTYLVFIWTTVAFNPYHTLKFRRTSRFFDMQNKKYDINTNIGVFYLVVMRVWAFLCWSFCAILTYVFVDEILNYESEQQLLLRTFRYHFVFILFMPMSMNMIIAGHLMRRHAGMFLQYTFLCFLMSAAINLIIYQIGNDTLDIGLYLMSAVVVLCIYLMIAVGMKASLYGQQIIINTNNNINVYNISVNQSRCRSSSDADIKALPVLKREQLSMAVNCSSTDRKNLSLFTNATAKDIKLHIEQDIQEKEELSAKIKPIICCCGACKMPLKVFWKVQCVISAITWWGYWGFVSISDATNYDTIFQFLYVIACCWWSPMVYSTTNRVLKGKAKVLFGLYFVIGVMIGIIECCLLTVFWYSEISDDVWNILPSDINTDFLHFSNFAIAGLVSATHYFPATGYLFYRSPLPFGLSHLAAVIITIFIPLTIVPLATRDIFTMNEYSIALRDITNFDGQINEKLTVIIFFLVVFAVFLSISGFSCTYFRFKKVLVESQAIVTGYKMTDDMSPFIQKDYPMTLTMFFTLLLAFGDFITDFLFAFAEYGLITWVKFTVIALFCIQIFIQLFSLQSAVKTVATQLQSINDANKDTSTAQLYVQQLSLLQKKLQQYCDIFWCILYPICWCMYYFVLCLISIVLGLTKLIAVREVQQWWLSLIFVNYKAIAIEKLICHEQEIQRNLEINKQREDIARANSDDQYQSHRHYRYVSSKTNTRASIVSSKATKKVRHIAHHSYHSSTYTNKMLNEIDIHALDFELNDGNLTSDDEYMEDIRVSVKKLSSQKLRKKRKRKHKHQKQEEKHIELELALPASDAREVNIDRRLSNSAVSGRSRLSSIFKRRNETMNDHLDNDDIDDNILINDEYRGLYAFNNGENYGGLSEWNATYYNIMAKMWEKQSGMDNNNKMKKKKRRFFDNVWLGWTIDNGNLSCIMKMYLFIDCYTPLWMRELHINADIYNTFFLTELIVESLPQCILIITNTYLTNDWKPIPIASLFFSGGMIVYNVLKIVYYVGYLGKDMKKVVL